MTVNFSNFSQDDAFNIKRSSNDSKKFDVFKNNDENDSSEHQVNIPLDNYASVQLHPLFMLNMQLLKDGYTLQEIQENGVFWDTGVADIDFSNPNLLKDILDGKITKNDIFSKTSKSVADIQAMHSAYISLKEKFMTQDVKQHIAERNKLAGKISAFLQAQGKEAGIQIDYSKSMILFILHSVNKDNKQLLQQLLEDPNFNNIYIDKALMSIDKDKEIKYGLYVLKMAQEMGYDKEFSFPLSILISEANEENIGMIEKMLCEQDFLSENNEFTSSILMGFLRNSGDELADLYVRNDDITLKEIQELIENGDDF